MKTVENKIEEDHYDEGQKDFLSKLNSADFGPLAYKLMNPEDRPGMSFEQTIDAIKKYKGFLFLYYANKGKALSPSRYIDYVWHTHILDTELYSVQMASLFGRYLHHFPFFGKRDESDEQALLAAAEFTKSQAFIYFDWDDDDWCGTGRKPKWPRPHVALGDLVNVIFPLGLNASAANQSPDVVTVQSGNFRHTLEHLDPEPDTTFSRRSSRLDYLTKILKAPIWVIACMPKDLGVLGDMFAVRQSDKLVEFSHSLVANRLSPEGFSNALVQLQVRN